MGQMVSLVLKMLIGAGKKVSEELNENTRHPDEVQFQTLMDILKSAENSEFGKEYDFQSIKTVEGFQKRIPLTDYDFFCERISRMVKGEENVLTGDKIVHFNVTSGTLGTAKKIPVTEKHVQVFARCNAKYLNCVAAQRLGTSWTKGKGLSLAEGTYEILPSGISVGCASSIQAARMGKMIPFIKIDTASMMYTSPTEARQPIVGSVYSRYLHALFALREKNITYGNVTFSSVLLESMRYIENHWQLLCDNIEKGSLDPDAAIPEEVQKTLLKKLKPMPKRAAELRKIFSEGFDTPFGPKVWPGLKFFMCVGGAGFQTYTDKLLDRYLGRDVHILYLGLSASEAMFSLPVDIDNPNSVFVPDASFYEFIPVENGERDDSQGIKLLGELEVGKQYEIIVTNVSGLYRYQMKDVIEVTGFYNKTPLVQFVNRSGFAVSMYAEKTSEKAIQYTAEKVAEALGLDMVDYCVCPYMDDNGGRYVFMYEYSTYKGGMSKDKIKEETEKILCEANPRYAAGLKKSNLQPLEVRVLQPETFMLYRDVMIMKGKSATQLKPVHVTKNPFQEKFFLGLEDKGLK